MNRESESAEKLEQFIEANRPALIRDIMELCSRPSVSGPPEGRFPYGSGCAEALDTAIRIAARRGFESTNHDYRCGTLVLPGTSSETIGIFCHLDVVAPGGGWTGDPFKPFIREGHILGRGATDNKGPLAAALSLLDFMKQNRVQLKHSILLYFGCSEENGMDDLKWYLDRFPPPRIGLTPDARFPVCHGEKGILHVDLEISAEGTGLRELTGGKAANMVPDHAAVVIAGLDQARTRTAMGEGFEIEEVPGGVRVQCRGTAAHAAEPWKGDSAIYKLVRSLAALGYLRSTGTSLFSRLAEALSDFAGTGLGIAQEDAPSGKLTAVGGTIDLRDDRVTLTVNVRYPVTADREALKRTFYERAGALGFVVKNYSDDPPLYLPKEHPLITILSDICNEVLGTSLEPYTMGGGTYARRLPLALAFGHLQREKARPGGGGHQADECVSIAGLEDMIRVYLRALQKIDYL
jgi:succinyl-diaminopimelate desuccinylase